MPFKRISYRGRKKSIKTMMGTILTLYRKKFSVSVSLKSPIRLYIESKVLLIKKKIDSAVIKRGSREAS